MRTHADFKCTRSRQGGSCLAIEGSAPRHSRGGANPDQLGRDCPDRAKRIPDCPRMHRKAIKRSLVKYRKFACQRPTPQPRRTVAPVDARAPRQRGCNNKSLPLTARNLDRWQAAFCRCCARCRRLRCLGFFLLFVAAYLTLGHDGFLCCG